MQLGKFDGYTLRQLVEEDYEQLEKWIASDSAHSGELDAEFFMGQTIDNKGELAPDPRATVFALEDGKGTVLYIRLSQACRVHIQFPPEPRSEDHATSREIHRHRRRVATALVKGMAFLEVGLERQGVSEWIFETESPRLLAMAQSRMGFASSPQEAVRFIPRLDHPIAEAEARSEGG